MAFDRMQERGSGAAWAAPASLIAGLLGWVSQALCCVPFVGVLMASGLMVGFASIGVLAAVVGMRVNTTNRDRHAWCMVGLIFNGVHFLVLVGVLAAELGLFAMFAPMFLLAR